MFAMQLHNFSGDILKITTAAEKELTIESELKKLVEVWKEQKFTLAKYTKGSEDRGFVLRGVDAITLLLEDMGLNLQSMLASPFVKPFMDDVRKWDQRLSLIGETIEVWMAVQRKWMYLESIFVGSDDIRQQLPLEAKRFDGIDRTWMKIMADTAKSTNVLEACSAEGRLATLTDLMDQLETCQKSLSEYLDSKRCCFPRFYFISDVRATAHVPAPLPAAAADRLTPRRTSCCRSSARATPRASRSTCSSCSTTARRSSSGAATRRCWA